MASCIIRFADFFSVIKGNNSFPVFWRFWGQQVEFEILKYMNTQKKSYKIIIQLTIMAIINKIFFLARK